MRDHLPDGLRLAGTTTVALALPGVAIEDCNAYSVFAIGSAAAEPLGGNALQVVVAVDATAEATTPSESAGPTATPQATDAVMPGNGSSTDGLGLVAALLVAGAASLALGIGMASQRRREPNA